MFWGWGEMGLFYLLEWSLIPLYHVVLDAGSGFTSLDRYPVARGSHHPKSQDASVYMDVNWEDPQNSSLNSTTPGPLTSAWPSGRHKFTRQTHFCSPGFCALQAAASVAGGHAAVFCHLCHCWCFGGIWDKSEWISPALRWQDKNTSHKKQISVCSTANANCFSSEDRGEKRVRKAGHTLRQRNSLYHCW